MSLFRWGSQPQVAIYSDDDEESGAFEKNGQESDTASMSAEEVAKAFDLSQEQLKQLKNDGEGSFDIDGQAWRFIIFD